MAGGRVPIRSSVMNDGNYSFIEYQDVLSQGPIDRIDVFRCSQPIGQFGVSGSGTTVQALAAADHLTPNSNKVFRSIYSHGTGTALPILLEMREEMNPGGLPSGSWDDRIRDLDRTSPTYGRILRIVVSPAVGQPNTYNVTYEIRGTGSPAPLAQITSPLTSPITQQDNRLVDIGVPASQLPAIDSSIAGNPLSFSITPTASRSTVDQLFSTFSNSLRSAPFATWRNNFYKFESFGDLGLKSTHPGTNLIGPPESVSIIQELLVFRAYR